MFNIEDLLNDPDFMDLPEEEQNAFIDEMREQEFGSIPPWQKVLSKVSRLNPFSISGDIQNTSDIGKAAFQTGQGILGNAPQNIAENPLMFAMGGLPGVQAKSGVSSGVDIYNTYQSALGAPDEVLAPSYSPEVDMSSTFEPQSIQGKIAGTLGNLATGALPFMAPDQVSTGIGKIFGNGSRIPKDIRRVKGIQEVFPSFVKKHTTSYGKALRKGYKDLISKGKLKVQPEDVDAIFGKVRYSKDLYEQLPSKAKIEIDRIYEIKDSMTPQQLRQASSRIRASLSKGEIKGTLRSERGRAIKQLDRDIRGYLKKSMPNMEQANKDYSQFTKTRGTVERLFEPGSGTQRGTKTLRNIKKIEPEDLINLKNYENEMGLNIIGPARRSATMKSLGKNVPLFAAGAAGLGALGYGASRVLDSFF